MNDKDNQNPLEFWKRSEKTKAELQNAEQRFQTKTYQERYRWAKVLSRIGAYTLPAVSIGSGVVALSSAMLGFMPWWLLAYPLAFILLGAWELGKGKTIETTSELAYSKGSRTQSLWLLPLCLLFALVSGYASLTGAEELHAIHDNQVGAIKDRYKAMEDSIQNRYDSLVLAEETELEEYMGKVKYEGRINIHNKANQETQRAAKAEVTRLNKERETKLNELSHDRGLVLKKAGSTFEKHRGMVVGIIVAVELLILLCNWYAVHYDYCISKEAHTIRTNLGKGSIALSEQDLKGFFWQFAQQFAPQYPTALPAPATGGGVGFKVGSNANTAKPPKQAPATTQPQAEQEPQKPKGRKGLAPRDCINCGKPYQPSVGWQKFCTKQCNHEYNGFNLKK